MKINRMSDYAIALLAKLAMASPHPLTTRDLAERLNLALAVVRKIMHQLKVADLVLAQQGSQGGYILAADIHAINLYAILVAIEGDMYLTKCTQANADCAVNCNNQLIKHWAQINSAIQSMLTSITLAQLLDNKPLPLDAMLIEE